MYIQRGRQTRQFRVFPSYFNLGIFQRIRVYYSNAFAVPNLLHLPLLLCPRILGTLRRQKQS